MSMKLLICVGLALLVGITVDSSFAGCICVRGNLKVAQVRGKVVYNARPRVGGVEEAIFGATIKVLKCRDGECEAIAEVTTDQNGNFNIEGIKRGEYELEAAATHFQRIVVGLKLHENYGREKQIVISLEPTAECCAGKAEVRKQKSTSRIP